MILKPFQCDFRFFFVKLLLNFLLTLDKILFSPLVDNKDSKVLLNKLIEKSFRKEIKKINFENLC